MNENEQRELERLAHSPIMIRALRKLFETHTVFKPEAVLKEDKLLGEEIRAKWEADLIITKVFKELDKLTVKNEAREPEKNPAR